MRAVAATAAVALTAGFVAMTAPQASANTSGDSVFPAAIGGFQIDGNFDASVYNGAGGAGSLDWNSTAVAPQPLGSDPIGTADTTVLSTGSKEAHYAQWTFNESAGATPKADIGNYYFYSTIFDMPDAVAHPGPHLFVYFAIERLGDTGTVDYAIELNQKATTHLSDGGVRIPDRTPGDLRLKIFNKGNLGLTIAATSSKWTCTNPADAYPGPETTCGWSEEEPIPEGAISGLVNDSTIPDPFTSAVAARQDGNLVAEQFVELGIDLTSLFAGHEVVPGCPSNVTFGQLNMRSRASESINSEMKDVINPVRIHIPDLCAVLAIEKVDDQKNPVPGATFLITPDPATRTGSVTAVDGGANDLTAQGAQAPADGLIEFVEAKPGSYTVAETAPPPGWIGDPAPQTKQADARVVTTFTFVNTLGDVTWQKVDADTGAGLGGATFAIHRTSGDGVQPNVTVTDNSPPDANPTAGLFAVGGLKTGDYTVTETVAPTGYNLPVNAVQSFTITAQTPHAVVGTAFQDPRQVGYLKIVKVLVDENGAPFTPADASRLDGATFVVYQDANDNGKLDPGEEAHLWPNPPADDSDVATATITGGAGSVVIGPLTLGDYRVAETAAPVSTVPAGDVDVTLTESTAQAPVSVTYTNKLMPLSIALAKDGPPLVHVGDTITYTFTVTNNGPLDLHDVTLTDSKVDDGTLTLVGNGDGDAVLAVNEVWTYTGTHVVTAQDPDPLPNTAEVTGTDIDGRTTSATAEHEVDIIHPAIDIVKTADPTTVPLGDTVTFTFVVTNIGDTTLYNVAVTDDVLGQIGTIGSLAPGASTTMTASEVAAVDTPATNIATASGTDVLQKQVTDTDDETITVINPPSIALEKAGPTLVHVGDTITYTFTVTNNGPVDLHDVTLTDSKVDDGTLTLVGNGDGDAVLAVNEVWTYTGTHVVTADDPDPLPNTADVTGTDAYGRTAEATADHEVDIIHPAIDIVKTADNTTPLVGDTVTFTYVVTNTGDTTLYNVAVTDDVLGNVGTIGTLDAGASKSLTATEVVAVDTPGTNVGTAVGSDVLQKQVTDTDDETITITAVNPPTPTPTPTPTVNPPAPVMPLTGANVSNPLPWAVGLVLIGGLLLLVGRERRPQARLLTLRHHRIGRHR